jgi:hypothetical protein
MQKKSFMTVVQGEQKADGNVVFIMLESSPSCNETAISPRFQDHSTK